MLGKVEVGHDEPDEQDDSAEAQQVEGRLLEELHVEHVSEADDAVVVPVLEELKLCYTQTNNLAKRIYIFRSIEGWHTKQIP